MAYMPASATLYTHIAAFTAGQLIKTGPCLLQSVSINTKGVTGAVLTLYDGTSAAGTVLAVIDTTQNVQTLLYNLACTTGLFIAYSGTTAGDITITWQ